MRIIANLRLVSTAAAIRLPVQSTKPDDAFVVSKDFVGFGIESAFLNNFANNFSQNLVSSLASRMSLPPILRIGGTSGDYFAFDPTQEADKVCLEEFGGCPNGHNAHYRLGPSYFDGYGWFQDAKMIIQAPLGNPVDPANTLAYVWQAWQKLGRGDRVSAIALGNEVEFIYRGGPVAYKNAALELQESVLTNVSLGGDKAAIFEAGNTASGTVVGNGELYTVEDIMDAGINDNGLISTAAEHWYQISGEHDWTDQEMQNLMINHRAISNRFNRYMPGIRAAHSRNIDYAITEDAAVLGGAPHSFSAGFGYALWAADFNLAAMTRGVARVSNLAGRPAAKRVFWVPDATGENSGNPGPHVRAPFPAAIFLADFVGAGDPSAVVEVDVGSDLMSAYAMYDQASGALQRIAVVNMRLYNGTLDTSRDRESFQIPVGTGISSVTVRSLRADLGVAAMGYDFGGPQSNVTWAGEQWTHAIDLGNGHFPRGPLENTIEVREGVATVVVPDSEAVIMFVRE